MARCPYLKVTNGAHFCTYLEGELGWKTSMAPVVCERCAAEVGAPETRPNIKRRLMGLLRVRIRTAGRSLWQRADGGDVRMNQIAAQFLNLSGGEPESIIPLLDEAVRQGLSPRVAAEAALFVGCENARRPDA